MHIRVIICMPGIRCHQGLISVRNMDTLIIRTNLNDEIKEMFDPNATVVCDDLAATVFERTIQLPCAIEPQKPSKIKEGDGIVVVSFPIREQEILVPFE